MKRRFFYLGVLLGATLSASVLHADDHNLGHLTTAEALVDDAARETILK